MKASSDEEISNVLRTARNQGMLNEDDTLVICVDLAIINDRLSRIQKCFPAGTLHAIPIKTSPLSFVLKNSVSKGMGLEAASLGEIYLAANAGVDSQKLVFDSPAKTPSEIATLKKIFPGCRLNADSLEELELYSRSDAGFRLGLRINPLVDSCSVASMNVGTKSSKFGVPLSSELAIIEACCSWQDLDCLHLHIGSQVPSTTPMIGAITKILELAKKINRNAGFQKIRYLDIGGGFPVNYSSSEHYRIEEFASEIESQCPQLYSGEFGLITEFGRYVFANSAWAATRVEYVKRSEKHQLIIAHAGADLFLRECYNSNDWYHNIQILDEHLRLRVASQGKTSIAGPLCFGGDFIAVDRVLPRATKGDTVVIRDAGANTFALWSRHCSRPFPKVIAYDSENPGERIHIGKERESYSEIVKFWS